MSTDFRWVAAGKEALAWIREISTNKVGVGFIVGPMPDQAYVLHPIFERVDGKPVQVTSSDGEQWLDQPDEDQAPTRRVTWAEYAHRRGVSMIQSKENPTWSMPFAEEFEASDDVQDVWPPSEGNLDDADTRQAVFDILLRHTSGGGSALTTAFHWGAGTQHRAVLAGSAGRSAVDENPVDSEVLRGATRCVARTVQQRAPVLAAEHLARHPRMGSRHRP